MRTPFFDFLFLTIVTLCCNFYNIMYLSDVGKSYQQFKRSYLITCLLDVNKWSLLKKKIKNDEEEEKNSTCFLSSELKSYSRLCSFCKWKFAKLWSNLDVIFLIFNPTFLRLLQQIIQTAVMKIFNLYWVFYRESGNAKLRRY